MLASEDEVFEGADPLTDSNCQSVIEKPEEFEDIFTPINNALNNQESDGNNDYRNNTTEEVNVNLNTDYMLTVDISDALSERDKVKYTVHTKTDMPEFSKRENSVVREHEEFIWLHDSLDANEEYAGYIIPPAPPRPDFDASREKLQKLGEGESTMTKEEFLKIKQELEQEYLATFKKTVAMHEVFLCRLAAHPIFRKNANFRIFLEYENELSVRGKNKKELVGSFFKRVTLSADEVLLSGQKDVDDFFDHERNYLLEYHSHIKDATIKADRVCRLRKNLADFYAKIASNIDKIAQTESNGGEKDFGLFLYKTSNIFERLKKAESRVGTDEELKEADTLRYFTRETQAAKELLYRRLRCLANYESANKALERARARNRDIPKAEQEQADACKKYEEIGVVAKDELINMKKRRVEAFKKNFAELVELEIKQSKNKLSIFQSALETLCNMSISTNSHSTPGNFDFTNNSKPNSEDLLLGENKTQLRIESIASSSSDLEHAALTSPNQEFDVNNKAQYPLKSNFAQIDSENRDEEHDPIITTMPPITSKRQAIESTPPLITEQHSDDAFED